MTAIAEFSDKQLADELARRKRESATAAAQDLVGKVVKRPLPYGDGTLVIRVTSSTEDGIINGPAFAVWNSDIIEFHQNKTDFHRDNLTIVPESEFLDIAARLRQQLDQLTTD